MFDPFSVAVFICTGMVVASIGKLLGQADWHRQTRYESRGRITKQTDRKSFVIMKSHVELCMVLGCTNLHSATPVNNSLMPGSVFLQIIARCEWIAIFSAKASCTCWVVKHAISKPGVIW